MGRQRMKRTKLQRKRAYKKRRHTRDLEMIAASKKKKEKPPQASE